ncbi:MAG: hypothetical protein J5861_04020 [Desulfovibrio sp.]|nr:hypothetical protein [Desulfovibrio sp.]
MHRTERPQAAQEDEDKRRRRLHQKDPYALPFPSRGEKNALNSLLNTMTGVNELHPLAKEMIHMKTP